jgi:hypothetical protein
MNTKTKYYKTILAVFCLFTAIFYNQICCAARIEQKLNKTKEGFELCLNLVKGNAAISLEEEAENIALLLKIPQSSYGIVKITIQDFSEPSAHNAFLIILDALQHNKTITTLDLKYNNIGAAVVKGIIWVLKENKTLTTLYLGYNLIGATGAKDIATAVALDNFTLVAVDLQNNADETTLDFSSTNIGAVDTYGLAEALKPNETLAKLNLGINDINADGAKDIVTAVPLGDFTLEAIKLPVESEILRYSLERNKLLKALLSTLDINDVLVEELLSISGIKAPLEISEILVDYAADSSKEGFLLSMIMKNPTETITQISEVIETRLKKAFNPEIKSLIDNIRENQRHVIELL